MTRFITLAGKKQVGKDTSASMIARILGQHFSRNASDSEFQIGPVSPIVHVAHFADALKDACVLVFGINRQDMETEEGKQKLTEILKPEKFVYNGAVVGYRPSQSDKIPMTVREVLQFVGTDLFRNQMDPDIWVKSVYRRQYGADDIVVVADCRFPNEAAFAKKNGLLVKLERNNGLGGDQHASERALDNYTDYDAVIDNNGDLVDLKEKWTRILREHGFIA